VKYAPVHVSQISCAPIHASNAPMQNSLRFLKILLELVQWCNAPVQVFQISCAPVHDINTPVQNSLGFLKILLESVQWCNTLVHHIRDASMQNSLEFS
jgi:hypothetical protein